MLRLPEGALHPPLRSAAQRLDLRKLVPTHGLGPTVAVLLVGLAACGGGGDPPVELSVDQGATINTSAASVMLTGRSFVPAGSSCPPSSEYIRIGTLGAHSLSAVNAATGLSHLVFDQLWLCNSEDGRVMHWQSNPIDLVVGNNLVTVTMSTGSRTSTAHITVLRSGG